MEIQNKEQRIRKVNDLIKMKKRLINEIKKVKIKNKIKLRIKKEKIVNIF